MVGVTVYGSVVNGCGVERRRREHGVPGIVALVVMKDWLRGESSRLAW